MPLEIVFVSLDRNSASLVAYMDECHGDWLYLEFGSPLIKQLSARFGVSGIPALVVVGQRGNVAIQNGRADVQSGEREREREREILQ